MTVTKTGTPIDIDAERPKMPDRGLAKLHLAMEQLLDNIKVLNNQLKEYAAEQYNTLVELERISKTNSIFPIRWCRRIAKPAIS